MFVHGALSLGRMKEAARAFVHGVFAMFEDASVAFDYFCEFLFGLCWRKVKALSQPRHIALRDNDVLVRATIAGAFRAIIERFQDGQFSFRHRK